MTKNFEIVVEGAQEQPPITEDAELSSIRAVMALEPAARRRVAVYLKGRAGA